MSDSVVERVKAAIAEKMAPAIDVRAPYAKAMFDMAARAAIEAMREPTEEMRIAGSVDPCSGGPDLGYETEVYQAIFDAALKGQ